MAHGIGATIRFTARTTARGSRSTARWFLRSTRAEGAGQSGLANLIDLHSINAAADALLTVALANTLFFSVDVNQARSRVAIYLLVTMAPFAVVAPVVGPVLDKFRHGRRYALAATHLARAFLAWVIAGAVASKGGFELYPAAFGALICSKAYGVSKLLWGYSRVTFLVGTDGRIAKVWPNVDPAVNATEVLAAAKELK